jgi:hypothetical protein
MMGEEQLETIKQLAMAKEMGIRYSRQCITKLMEQGEFPRPIGSNPGSTRFHWRLAPGLGANLDHEQSDAKV